MKRRTLLTGLSGACLMLTGCVSGTPDNDDGNPGAGNNPDGSIETIGSECGGRMDDWAIATVDADRLVIDGVTPAPDPCHEAVLSAYELDGDRLDVSIGVESSLDGNEECVECVGAIEYTAEIAGIEGDVKRVVLDHDEGEDYDLDPHDANADTSVDSTSIDTLGTDSGEADSVTASWRGSIVSLEGTLSAPDPCHEARIVEADVSDGELRIEIEAIEAPDAGGACAEVMSHVTYEATVELAGPPSLEAVLITHTDGGSHTITERGG